MNKKLAGIIAVTGWFAVIAQLWLMMVSREEPKVELLVQFFSYFTILVNILVAVYLSVAAFSKQTNESFFTRAGVQTALTVYIIVVGVTYNLILRFTWAPQGMQRVVDELLHAVVPFLAVLYWFMYVPKENLQYKNCFSWMWFPLAYIIFIALRGAASGYYPYPFIDVNKLGYPRALLNAAGLVLIFMGLSLFLTAVGKWLSRRQPLQR